MTSTPFAESFPVIVCPHCLTRVIVWLQQCVDTGALCSVCQSVIEAEQILSDVAKQSSSLVWDEK